MTIIHQNEKKNRTFYHDEKHNYNVYDIPNIVAVLPILPNGNVVLVEQYRVPAATCTLKLVCGGIEAGEKPEKAAVREVKEEIGYQVSSYVSVGHYVSCPAYKTERVYVFLAFLNKESAGQQLEEHEVLHNLQKIEVSIDEALQLCQTKDVRPDLELALMKYKEYLRSNKKHLLVN